MRNKQVAIIDFGSSEIRAVVGEKGVNQTFIIKAKKTFAYDGYTSNTFLSPEQVKSVLLDVGDFFKNTGKITDNVVYVGVPSNFTQIFNKDCQISFDKSKKITEDDVEKLYDSAFVNSNANRTLINRSAIIYELNDYRRLAYPVGMQSNLLKGKLSFVVCDNYFVNAVKPSLEFNGYKAEFVSCSLAQSMYLLDEETRDRLAVLVDVGYITTSFSVIQGDGIIYEKTFDYGGGYITAALTEQLDVDFNLAETLKRKVNLSGVASNSSLDVVYDGNGKYYNAEQLRDIIKSSIDELCENISFCLDDLPFILPDYVPIKITGGGICFIRGAKERIASRLGVSVETVSPSVPLMNNPLDSTILSLLDIALKQ